jgi:hypothetical protein
MRCANGASATGSVRRPGAGRRGDAPCWAAILASTAPPFQGHPVTLLRGRRILHADAKLRRRGSVGTTCARGPCVSRRVHRHLPPFVGTTLLAPPHAHSSPVTERGFDRGAARAGPRRPSSATSPATSTRTTAICCGASESSTPRRSPDRDYDAALFWPARSPKVATPWSTPHPHGHASRVRGPDHARAPGGTPRAGSHGHTSSLRTRAGAVITRVDRAEQGSLPEVDLSPLSTRRLGVATAPEASSLLVAARHRCDDLRASPRQLPTPMWTIDARDPVKEGRHDEGQARRTRDRSPGRPAEAAACGGMLIWSRSGRARVRRDGHTLFNWRSAPVVRQRDVVEEGRRERSPPCSRSGCRSGPRQPREERRRLRGRERAGL